MVAAIGGRPSVSHILASSGNPGCAGACSWRARVVSTMRWPAPGPGRGCGRARSAFPPDRSRAHPAGAHSPAGGAVSNRTFARPELEQRLGRKSTCGAVISDRNAAWRSHHLRVYVSRRRLQIAALSSSVPHRGRRDAALFSLTL